MDRVKRALLALNLVCLAPHAAGQSLTSLSYIPLEHPTTPFLENLIARGILVDPSPMVRPFTVQAARAGLDAVDRDALGDGDRDIVEWLLVRFTTRAGKVYLAGEFDAAIRASTHARRIAFSLREDGPGHVLPMLGANVGLQFGPGLLVTNLVINPNLWYDPDYSNRDDLPAPVRFSEAYASFRSNYADFDFGNLSRNWGPSTVPSVALSNWPYSYDHLYARLGPKTVYLQMVVATLDNMADGSGESGNRYWVAQRLMVQPWKSLDVSIWQGNVITRD